MVHITILVSVILSLIILSPDKVGLYCGPIWLSSSALRMGQWVHSPPSPPLLPTLSSETMIWNSCPNSPVCFWLPGSLPWCHASKSNPHRVSIPLTLWVSTNGHVGEVWTHLRHKVGVSTWDCAPCGMGWTRYEENTGWEHVLSATQLPTRNSPGAFPYSLLGVSLWWLTLIWCKSMS